MKRIDSTAIVQTNQIGENTKIWQFCVVLQNAIIGSDCNICSHVFIEDDVIIQDRVTIKAGVQVWDGIRIENDVFIGPNVTFTNDLLPRSKKHLDFYPQTIIKNGASIGANATILAGNVIGEYAIIGAGSVVTKDVPAFGLVYGNPAKLHGYITKEGVVLDMNLTSKTGELYLFKNGELILA